MAKILPLETKICNAVKDYMVEKNFSYAKKFTDKITREGIQSNYRSHKFWLVHQDFNKPVVVTIQEFYDGLVKLVREISEGDYYVKSASGGFRISPKEDVPCI